MGSTVRFVQVNIHLLVAGVPLGSHDILNIVQQGIEAFIDDEPCLLLRLL